MVAPYSKNYTVSTVLFHKYGGSNVGVTICMSYFSVFVTTKANVKLANGNTLYAQSIGIILCCFPNCTIIYIQLCQFINFQFTLLIKYYWVTSNVILVFKRLHLNFLKIVIFFTLKVVLGYHPTIFRTVWTIYKSILSKSNIKVTDILWYQLYVASKNRISLRLFIRYFIVSWLPG